MMLVEVSCVDAIVRKPMASTLALNRAVLLGAYIDTHTMTDMNEVIVKSDRRGRLRYTPEQKQALVEAYETSGLS